MKNKINFGLSVAVFGLLALGFVKVAFAQDFTQGYSSDETLVRGSVVALNPEDKNKVETLNSEREDDLFGVVVRSNDTALTITDDVTGVFVATSGRFEILVSNINGSISNNDYLAISSIKGIGMRADETQKLVIGKALQDIDFSSSDEIISQFQVEDSSGRPFTVSVGRILAEIDIEPNPNAAENQGAPEFLVTFTETVAGKPVSSLRIYSALGVLVVGAAISGSLLYSAVKSSITSIGRNPLSRKSVLAGLAQVIIISSIILFSGLFAVYLILII